MKQLNRGTDPQSIISQTFIWDCARVPLHRCCQDTVSSHYTEKAGKRKKKLQKTIQIKRHEDSFRWKGNNQDYNVFKMACSSLHRGETSRPRKWRSKFILSSWYKDRTQFSDSHEVSRKTLAQVGASCLSGDRGNDQTTANTEVNHPRKVERK